MKGKIVFSILLFMILLYGGYIMVFEMEYNSCDMTYMYELPRYQKLALDSRLQKRFPNYALYFYGEGTYFSNYKNAAVLDGVPVLFIPGNAGSYRQVRSMGSVALRMAESRKKSFYFNYFSLDFNEDLSAFSGEIVHQQTQFAIKCIEAIRSKYRSQPPVVVVGHSMGGIVARNLFHSPGFKAAWVHTIITQATPHLLPVFPADAMMRAIYDRLDLMWRRPGRRSLANITLVSITGGSRDVQVRDGLGDTSPLSAVKSRTLWRSSSAIRRAWASADHLCAVWCKQVVMNLNRALFEMVDAQTRQLLPDAARRIAIFRRHLTVDTSRGGAAVGAKETRIDENGAQWIYRVRTDRFAVQREEVRAPILIKFGPFSAREPLRAVLVANEVKAGWLFLCRSAAADAPCASGVDVSAWAVDSPPYEINRRIVHLQRRFFEAESDDVFLVVRLPPTKKEVEVFYERYDAARRHLRHNPGVADFLLALPLVRDLHARMLLPQTAPGAVYYRIALPGLYHVRQGLEVKVRVISCASTAGSVGLIALHSPWDGHYVHTSVWYWSNASLNLYLASSRPADQEKKEAAVELILDPTCQYRVFLQHSAAVVASQFLRVYSFLMPTYVLLHALGGLGVQLMSAARGDSVEGIGAVKTVVPLILPSLVMGYILNTGPMSSLPIPVNDVTLLQREGIWFPLVFQVLFIVSIAFFVLLILLCKFLVAIVAFPLCGQGARMPCRLVAHLIGLITALLAIYATTKVCGGLATLILFLGQLLLTAIEKASNTRNRSPDNADILQIRFSILLLLGFVAIINAPSLVIWVKLLMDNNFKRLPVPTGVDSLPILLSFAFLSLARSGPGLWRRKPLLTRCIGYVALATAIAGPLFSSFAFHRQQWAVATVLSVMGLSALVLKAANRLAHHKTD